MEYLSETLEEVQNLLEDAKSELTSCDLYGGTHIEDIEAYNLICKALLLIEGLGALTGSYLGPRSEWTPLKVKKPKKGYLYLCGNSKFVQIGEYMGGDTFKGFKGFEMTGMTHWALLPRKIK